MYDMGLDRPNVRCSYCLFTHHVRYVLRPENVVCTQDDLLRDYQTLLHNWVVIKVVFEFVGKHAMRQTIKMEFAPLYMREISLDHSND